MKKIGIWILIIICVAFVQTCTKAFFKAKRINEQKKEWKIESSSRVDKKVIKQMGKTSDIDEKLVILAEGMNKSLPKQLDDMTILKKIEIHENREVRYCYTILQDLDYSKEAIEEHRKFMVRQVRQATNLNKFKEYGVTMAYAYYKQNGECMMLVRVYPEDYK